MDATARRTAHGWVVDGEPVGSAVEALTLADLLVPAADLLVERGARVAARGNTTGCRIAELERRVAQLEHALAARVVVERAIGAMAAQLGLTPEAAFATLRRHSRETGQPVPEVALATLDALLPTAVNAVG